MLSQSLQEKLEDMQGRRAELEQSLATPEVAQDPNKLRALSKEFGALEKFVSRYDALRHLLDQRRQAEAVIEETDGDDPELRQLAEDEVAALDEQIVEAEEGIRELFATEDKDTSRDVIVEIRAGTGGDEAALFAADLFGMYHRYAERKGWSLEVMQAHPTDLGGYKEIVFSIEGQNVYQRLKYESGVHRVQRIPATETSGRRHTSAVTVAVLPAAEEVDVEINDDDLQWDIFRASGPGGQSVNKTSSAVRLTHVPTGTVVSMQDERSQHKNRAKALRVLRSRLYDLQREKEAQARGELRRSQVGSGDRSERIRTYNFPENRCNDHRINLTLYDLENIVMGDLDQVVEPLIEHEKQQRLSEL
jgi:peptide chain release factor 1